MEASAENRPNQSLVSVRCVGVNQIRWGCDLFALFQLQKLFCLQGPEGRSSYNKVGRQAATCLTVKSFLLLLGCLCCLPVRFQN